MTFRSKKQSQPGLRFSSLIVLLISVLNGCGHSSTPSNPSSDTQPQDGVTQTGNHQPSASISAPQSVTSGEMIKLDGSGSSDPDDGSLSYQWMKTAGPDITLSNTTGSSLSFVAPSVAQPQQISFQLTVRDSGGLSDSTSVNMQISPSEPPPPTNHQPSVQITAPQSATSGETVTLDGSGSSDPDGDTLSYLWMKTAGPEIMLSNTTGSSLSFVAPSVAQSQQIGFHLTVRDSSGLSSSSNVSMQISPIVDNNAPSIVSRSPEADQSEVSPMAEIQVTFNEALLASSVDNQSLVVTQNGNPVPGSVSYDSSSHGVTFQPTSALSGGVGYTVNISQSLTDVAGNAFAGASWNFTTGICATAEENASLTLTCPSGQVINDVKFASYGTPGGSCGSFTTGACNASNSASVVLDACKGMDICTLKASNDAFGDPCFGTGKKLAAQVACGMAPPAPEPGPAPSQCSTAWDTIGDKGDGVALTPPMGWNSWNVFHENINEEQIKQIADAMVSSGMKDAGYQYINLDDNWMAARENGKMMVDRSRFPHGMDGLADYIHGLGLKLGIYGDRGVETCHNYNNKITKNSGSYGHEENDAQTFASWGIDYLKYDNCAPAPGRGGDQAQREDYEAMSSALRATGRPIVFSICAWDYKSWMPSVGHLWRSTFDIGPCFSGDNGCSSWYRNIDQIIDENNDSPDAAGPGHWNDPDMLEVGNPGLSDTEATAHFSMWAIMAAPLIAGNDLRNMSDTIRNILTNKEVIDVNQDPAGIQGTRVVDNGDQEVWMKPLCTPDGTEKAVALFNRGGGTSKITVSFNDIGITGAATVRDLWAHQDKGEFNGSYSADVPSHGVVMLKISATN